MSKVKIVALGLVAAFAFTAFASGSAQAFWLVNGTLLVGSAAISSTTVTDKNGVLSGGGVGIECTGLGIKGGTISSPDKVLATSLEFTGCIAIEPEKCKLVGSTVGTVPVEGLVTLDGALAVKAKGKPENTNGIFATFKFEGTSCSISGTKQVVTGTATILSPEGQDNREWHLVTALTEVASELQLGSANATISGSTLVRLENDAQWSFM